MGLTQAAYYIAAATWTCIQVPARAPGRPTVSESTFNGRPVYLASTECQLCGRIRASCQGQPIGITILRLLRSALKPQTATPVSCFTSATECANKVKFPLGLSPSRCK
jgi:hypothetical protein